MKGENNSVYNKGYDEQGKIDNKIPPRAETSEATQRPVATNKTVKSDRGSFPDKC